MTATEKTTTDEPPLPTTDPPLESTGTATTSTTPPKESTSESGSSGMADGGCDAVDILFVVDTFQFFEDVRDRHLAALDGFVATLADTFVSQSLHIGVIGTSEYWPYGDECTWLGDLLTTTQRGACLPEDGPHFATSDDDLAEVVPCLLDLDLWGGIQYPVTGAIAALSDEQAAPGACNEGFLRDDAVLGIFFITNDPPVDVDMDDAHPDAVTYFWDDALLAAKNDDPTALVVFGMVAMEPVDCITYYAAENTNLIELIDAFGSQGLRASVCEPDWGPSLEAGIDLLADTCAAWEGP